MDNNATYYLLSAKFCYDLLNKSDFPQNVPTLFGIPVNSFSSTSKFNLLADPRSMFERYYINTRFFKTNFPPNSTSTKTEKNSSGNCCCAKFHLFQVGEETEKRCFNLLPFQLLLIRLMAAYLQFAY